MKNMVMKLSKFELKTSTVSHQSISQNLEAKWSPQLFRQSTKPNGSNALRTTFQQNIKEATQNERIRCCQAQSKIQGTAGRHRGNDLLVYDGFCFEVEFFDANGDTIDAFTTPAELLELVNEV